MAAAHWHPARGDGSPEPLFSPAVAVADLAWEGEPGPEGERRTAELFATERAHLARAVPKRRREFAAGRACARRAMASLGEPPAPIAVGTRREPVWPEGLVGAIAHTAGYAVAAVARRREVRSLGVDVEPAEELERRLWGAILTEGERSELERAGAAPTGGGPAPSPGLLARLVFSAKETVYKCQHPLTGEWLDFGDVHVALDLERSRFTATFLRAAGGLPRGLAWSGRFALGGERLVTALELPAALELTEDGGALPREAADPGL